MAGYKLSKKAVQDLSEIWAYTAERWSENQADKYYQLIIDTCDEVALNPKLGKKYPQVKKGLRGFRGGKHILFYRQAKPKTIEIIRILHERMDLKFRIG
ncbi:MAG: type II toxin-antitoxin system RelE/ParE family toxin [Flavobacteriales bacterium]